MYYITPKCASFYMVIPMVSANRQRRRFFYLSKKKSSIAETNLFVQDFTASWLSAYYFQWYRITVCAVYMFYCACIGVTSHGNHILLIVGRVKNINVIQATVPILDFYDTVSRAECDMNINNITGVRNSHLLHCYCSCKCTDCCVLQPSSLFSWVIPFVYVPQRLFLIKSKLVL